MRALLTIAGFITGFMCGVGCTPLMEVQTPPADVTVKMVEPPPENQAPKNPKMVCQWEIVQAAGGVSLVEEGPQKMTIDQLQAGGVVFEYEAKRRMKCRRLPGEDEAKAMPPRGKPSDGVVEVSQEL